ncbi:MULTISPECIES: type II toxin-antitoxin system HicA family toxin [unclassified Frankia]|uniref:type II toxin-antitoxin system HicA family toxin n=1 Tax=unclassified Frankia TaxID=2632575 RepID=UPI002AD493C9|nr:MULTISPECIES: type II toxin-antitoxin system HicA family toxin [unclassified Frankia]
MPNTPSSEEICKILEKHGFRLAGQKGSHRKYRHDGPPGRTVIVPMGRKNMRIGTFRSIVGQSGLSITDFLP